MKLSIKLTFCFLSFILLGYLIYWPSFTGGFVFDDFTTIVHNPAMYRMNLDDIWFYRPLRFLPDITFAANYLWTQQEAWSYRLVNWFIHVVTAIAVFFFVKLIAGLERDQYELKKDEVLPMAYFTAMIFLVHPLQTSAASYIVQRSTLMATLFMLLSLIGYLLYRIKLQKKYLVGSLLMFLLALFSKTFAVTLPFIILLTEKFYIKKKRGSAVAFYFIALLIIPLVYMIWKTGQGIPLAEAVVFQQTSQISHISYLLTQFNVIIVYLWLLVVPIGQMLDYNFPYTHSLFSGTTMFAMAAVIGIIVWSIKLKSNFRGLAYAVLFFFIALSSESSIFPIEDVLFEHRLYWPMVGFAYALMWGIHYLTKNIRNRRAIACLIIFIFSLLAFQRNQVWSSSVLLLEDNAKKSPRNARVLANLGMAYIEENRLAEAELVYADAMAADPEHPESYNNRGSLYGMLGRYEESLHDLNAAIQIRPNYVEAFYNRGSTNGNLGRYKEAEADFLKAIELSPSYYMAYVGLGQLYALQGQEAKSKKQFAKAYLINPFAFKINDQ